MSKRWSKKDIQKKPEFPETDKASLKVEKSVSSLFPLHFVAYRSSPFEKLNEFRVENW